VNTFCLPMPFLIATQLLDLYGVGKHLVLKELLGDSEFRKHAEIFLSGPCTQHDEITEANYVPVPRKKTSRSGQT